MGGGGGQSDVSVQTTAVQLVDAVRTLMRSSLLLRKGTGTDENPSIQLPSFQSTSQSSYTRSYSVDLVLSFFPSSVLSPSIPSLPLAPVSIPLSVSAHRNLSSPFPPTLAPSSPSRPKSAKSQLKQLSARELL